MFQYALLQLCFVERILGSAAKPFRDVCYRCQNHSHLNTDHLSETIADDAKNLSSDL